MVHPVAKQAFVSITVARQRGTHTPFRFFIPFFRFCLLLFSRFKQFERIERFKPQFQPPFDFYTALIRNKTHHVHFFASPRDNLTVTGSSILSGAYHLIFPDIQETEPVPARDSGISDLYPALKERPARNERVELPVFSADVEVL